MNRRGFLTSILALSAAPAIVRADSLMRIVPKETIVIGVDYGAADSTVFTGYGYRVGDLVTIDYGTNIMGKVQFGARVTGVIRKVTEDTFTMQIGGPAPVQVKPFKVARVSEVRSA